MNPQDRSSIARSRTAERVAEAQRARLAHGDCSTDDDRASMAVEFSGPVGHGLIDRLRGLRAAMSARSHAAA